MMLRFSLSLIFAAAITLDYDDTLLFAMMPLISDFRRRFTFFR